MIDLDLDKLQTPNKSIKLDGRVMEMKYPSLSQLGKLLGLAGKIKSEDETVILTAIEDLTGLFKKLIPELGEYELNLNQMYALIEVFSQISTPEEMKATSSSDTKKN